MFSVCFCKIFWRLCSTTFSFGFVTLATDYGFYWLSIDFALLSRCDRIFYFSSFLNNFLSDLSIKKICFGYVTLHTDCLFRWYSVDFPLCSRNYQIFHCASFSVKLFMPQHSFFFSSFLRTKHLYFHIHLVLCPFSFL